MLADLRGTGVIDQASDFLDHHRNRSAGSIQPIRNRPPGSATGDQSVIGDQHPRPLHAPGRSLRNNRRLIGSDQTFVDEGGRDGLRGNRRKIDPAPTLDRDVFRVVLGESTKIEAGGSSIVFSNDAAAAGVAVWNRFTIRTLRLPSTGDRLACTISGSASSSRRRLLPVGFSTCRSA